MPCLETIIRNMYLKEDHMSGKSVIVMGKKGVVANKTGSDGITTNDEIYNIRFEDGSISTHPVRDMQMIGESVDRLVEMNPAEHVKKDDETGMYCVYNKDGKKVKEFKDKADADKWATDNHDSLMESSVEHLDEGLVLASDDLNAVKKTAQKLAKQSPDLTYYVVKHNERYMKGMKYAYYEVYQSVDMHLVRGKVKKIAGYGAKVDMRESVEELDEGTPAYRKAMAAYKNSDTKKVFDILTKKGFRAYAQSDTLVRNMLKKNKGNVQKAVAEIEKKYPNHFKESVEELDEVINSPARGRAKEANVKRGRTSDPGGDMVITAGKDSSGKVFYATSIDRTSGDILKVGTNAKEAVKLTKGNATKLVRGKASFVTAINLNKGIGNTKKVSDAELKKLIGEEVELDEAFDMKKMLKIFNKLKKNDTIKIKYDSSMRKGKDFQTFVVTSPKRTVGKKGVERVIMKHVDNPTGVKYTLYNRDGSVSLAVGDMAASMTDIQESVELDEAADQTHLNTAIIAKQVKQAVKKYTTGNLIVRSKGGKTRFIMVAAGHIDNKLRKMMIDLMSPNANIHNKDDISYGNVTDTVINAETRHWAKALGLKESVENLDEMQPHGMFGGFGGQKKKSTRPSRPTRIAVDKEFANVTRSGKMDTMAAKKHLEKKFKITDVRIEKDKNGKPHVTYFQESTHPEDNTNHPKNSQSSSNITDILIKKRKAAKAAAAAAAKEQAAPWRGMEVTSVELDEADRPMQFPGKMSGGKMKGKFTNAQLKQLKDAYGKIGRVDPASKTYDKLTAYLDGMDKEQLTQLVNARIQFISSLARNRLMRLDG